MDGGNQAAVLGLNGQGQTTLCGSWPSVAMAKAKPLCVGQLAQRSDGQGQTTLCGAAGGGLHFVEDFVWTADSLANQFKKQLCLCSRPNRFLENDRRM